MNWTTITGLIVTGLVLLAVDFYLPGFILGSVGVILMLIGTAICYNTYGFTTATILGIGEMTLGIGVAYISIKYFPKTAVGKKMILEQTQTGVRSQDTRAEDWIGREGTAQTVLRPSGIGLLDGKRLDVVAESGMISQGSAIRVVAVQDNRIVVTKI